MTNDFRHDLEPIVERAEARILARLREVIPDAALKRIGPAGQTKPSWSCWIVTRTDLERDQVAGDVDLLASLNELASDAGLAPDVFCVQSQETVDREFEGNWLLAMQ